MAYPKIQIPQKSKIEKRQSTPHPTPTSSITFQSIREISPREEEKMKKKEVTLTPTPMS